MLTPSVRTGAAAFVLLAAGAAACAAPHPENIPQVSGALGTRPTITVPNLPPPKEGRMKVLHEGSGPAVKKGQVAVTDVEMKIWEGNKKLMSTWGLTQPTTVSFDGEHVSRTWDQALLGRRAGSRVLMVTPATSGFGPHGMAPAQVSPSDHMILVFDLVGGYGLDQRVPTADAKGTGGPGAAREGAPVVAVSAGQAPQVRSWGGAAAPKKLDVRMLAEGSGPVLQDGDVAVVQYAAWTWAEKTPFRSTYAVTGPNGFVVAPEAVPPGVYEALRGMRVGSRVQIAVPARYKPGFKMTKGGVAVPPGKAVLYVMEVLDRQDR
ncbi:FKBP-type peptidyl-prolyl cis-trans isomerase [Streptomyces sp. NPDC050095]|uniref:FKBP-type peptidyl-prolyl cis-trans isomerase n=1 Tax=unclassified Streptomyces TaxID=2593676 RepID=UPI003425DF4A